ncbi:hypothetical protein B9N43_10830 [Denitratisoma sp. DHT3]|uniref:type IV pilus biogenesis protein PilM n=1 Tax=Denitratisoma sp. DHT3 TaxID=1981880 RepID=UPI001198C243|nr:agglutinin biogenesis protein MshI [Denitratisoma sp. DHT3]QDX81704.1 hypothetical protein B9N43_10830 [Denitratisoma sp. DHT3]
MALGRRRQREVEGWESVVFFPTEVEVARVRRRPGERPQLLSWDSYGTEGTETETLNRLQKANRLGQGRCTTLLAHGQYQMIQTEAPAVPTEERRDALRWRIKEMVDFPVESAGIDVFDIPASSGGIGGRAPQVYVVAAPNAALAQRIQAFQAARLPLSTIDIPELAQRNVAALFEEENRGLALLAFSHQGGCLTFTYQGELFASRHIDVTQAEMLAAGNGGNAALFERVLLDVQRSMDNFDRTYSFITLSRLLVAPLPGAEAFIGLLRESLFQPVEVLDLSLGLDIAAVPVLAEPLRQSEALLAIGAALRDELP